MGDARMSSGSEFQTVGASKAKLKPNCLVDHTDIDHSNIIMDKGKVQLVI